MAQSSSAAPTAKQNEEGARQGKKPRFPITNFAGKPLPHPTLAPGNGTNSVTGKRSAANILTSEHINPAPPANKVEQATPPDSNGHKNLKLALVGKEPPHTPLTPQKTKAKNNQNTETQNMTDTAVIELEPPVVKPSASKKAVEKVVAANESQKPTGEKNENNAPDTKAVEAKTDAKAETSKVDEQSLLKARSALASKLQEKPVTDITQGSIIGTPKRAAPLGDSQISAETLRSFAAAPRAQFVSSDKSRTARHWNTLPAFVRYGLIVVGIIAVHAGFTTWLNDDPLFTNYQKDTPVFTVTESDPETAPETANAMDDVSDAAKAAFSLPTPTEEVSTNIPEKLTYNAPPAPVDTTTEIKIQASNAMDEGAAPADANAATTLTSTLQQASLPETSNEAATAPSAESVASDANAQPAEAAPSVDEGVLLNLINRD